MNGQRAFMFVQSKYADFAHRDVRSYGYVQQFASTLHPKLRDRSRITCNQMRRVPLAHRAVPGGGYLGAIIMVVDDNPSVRKSTSRLLRAHGYTVHTVCDATRIMQDATATHPDVILMDLHIANYSGIEVAREIKQVSQLADIPIIAISATPPDWAYLSQLFASVLHKPCPAKELLSAIEAAIAR